jgi:outer membrane protein, multidrug efflux system
MTTYMTHKMTHSNNDSLTPRSTHRSWRTAVIAITAALWLSACRTVGPNYTKPDVRIPTGFRGADAAAAQPGTDATSVADKPWPEVFQDAQLRQLIQTALQQNYDVRIAANRILQAEAQLGVTRSNQKPTVEAGGSLGGQRFSTAPAPPFTTDVYRLNLGINWEIDFWGKFRRATEAAQAAMLASEWARQSVISTLVADIASSYFRLRELDLELGISQRTLASRRESLQLSQTLADRGLGTMLDVRQAEQLVYTAAARIPDIERQIEQEENFISTLVGNEPQAIPRGLPVEQQMTQPLVPAGLTSSLLERRPDIRAAEQRLIALNAQIGVAQAALFPRISLTGAGGFQSTALNDLFTGSAGFWSIAGGFTHPIFNAGRLRRGVELAEAQQQEALLVYQQVIQQAFREVSDALVAYRKNQEFRTQQENLTLSAREASALADQRFRAGVTSYLEVLTNETNLFAAELGLARARSNELEAQVQIYRALGGGWKE